MLTLENSVLHHQKREASPDASVTVRLTKDFFLRLVTGQAGLREMVFSEDIDVDGSRIGLLSFLALLERPEPGFPIVTP